MNFFSHFMQPCVVESSRIILRNFLLDDVREDYVRWMNDSKVMSFMESRWENHTKESLAQYVYEISRDNSALFLAIILKSENRHIGNVKLGSINPRHRTGEIGILIGEKDCWGKGIACESIKLVSHYAKETLKLRKLTAGCYSSNTGSLKTFQKAGFVIEGIKKAQYQWKEEYVDGILLGKVL